ncbi:MAG: hypothetical protein IJ439_00935 [Tyzzerella sp.]|nr:hypothetical protein [Tyzzerella sp.]
MMNAWLADAIENVKGFITLTIISGVAVVLLSLIVICVYAVIKTIREGKKDKKNE